ncbi:MAG: ParB/RepB/Spo0J family partition protein [Sphingomonadales bacterium]|nr:ParB/RepB/Spo0J family partition protein [Sphingomonadales bacterium]
MTSPAKRPKGLGRGLDALFSEAGRDMPTVAGDHSTQDIVRIPTGSIKPHPDQPRRHFDDAALGELAASIAERGVIQPIIVRPAPQGRGYQLVAGERRWRAAQRAGLHDIPAIVRDFDEAETLEIALVENIQREDLNAIEEARAYQRLTEDFDHSQEALARLVGKSRSHVANMLRLLDLPKRVQTMVVEGQLSMGHARALINAPNPVALAKDVERRGLSVRQVEQMVRALRDGDAAKRAPATGEGKARDPDIQAVEEHLSDLLGLSVKITDKPKRGGTVSLAYSSLDQLDMICQRLSGEKI